MVTREGNGFLHQEELTKRLTLSFSGGDNGLTLSLITVKIDVCTIEKYVPGILQIALQGGYCGGWERVLSFADSLWVWI